MNFQVHVHFVRACKLLSIISLLFSIFSSKISCSEEWCKVASTDSEPRYEQCIPGTE